MRKPWFLLLVNRERPPIRLPRFVKPSAAAQRHSYCNAVGSSIARNTHGGVYLHAGPEIGVASTRAFTSQLTVIALLTLLLGRMRRISHGDGVAIAQALEEIPNQMKKILKQSDSIKEIAKKYCRHNNFLYLGRSYNFPVALERRA